MPIRARNRVAVAFVLCAVVMTAVSIRVSAETASSTRVVFTSGEAAPDGNGSFQYLGTALLNDAGQVAFSGTLENTSGGFDDDTGIFRADRGGEVVTIVREGQPAGGSGSVFYYYFNDLPFIFNNAGQVAFRAQYTTSSVLHFGVFRGDGQTAPTRLIGFGDPVPNANGSLAALGGYPSLNDSGQVAYWAGLDGTTGGQDDYVGIFGTGGATGSVQYFRQGDPAPDGNGSMLHFDAQHVPLNNLGEAAIRVIHQNTLRSGLDSEAIYRSDGTTGPIQIVREYQTAPDGNGRFQTLLNPVLNDAGQVAFFAFLLNADNAISGSSGIFRGDGTATPIRVVRRNDPAPDGNGRFELISSNPLINNTGQVAFTSVLSGTSRGASDDTGLFLFDDNQGIIQIVRENQTTPDGNGRFGAFDGGYSLNEAGQIAFMSELRDTLGGASDDRGIFLFDPDLGLHEVAREGDAMLNSTVTDLYMMTGDLFEWDTGFNNLGQIAYTFDLADGRNGIALWGLADPDRLIGDFDGDGEVGQGDLNLVLDFWGDTAIAGVSPDSAWLDPTDITGALIGQDELAMVLQNWGNTTAVEAELGAIGDATGLSDEQVRSLIPEPGTAALMAGLCLIALKRQASRHTASRRC